MELLHGHTAAAGKGKGRAGSALRRGADMWEGGGGYRGKWGKGEKGKGMYKGERGKGVEEKGMKSISGKNYETIRSKGAGGWLLI